MRYLEKFWFVGDNMADKYSAWDRLYTQIFLFDQLISILSAKEEMESYQSLDGL